MRYFSTPLARHLLTLAVFCCLPMNAYSLVPTYKWKGAFANNSMNVANHWRPTHIPNYQYVEFYSTPVPTTYTPYLNPTKVMNFAGMKFNSTTPFKMKILGSLYLSNINYPSHKIYFDNLTSTSQTIYLYGTSFSSPTIVFVDPAYNPTYPIHFYLYGYGGFSTRNYATMNIQSTFSSVSTVYMRGYSKLYNNGISTTATLGTLNSSSTDSIFLSGTSSTLAFGAGGDGINQAAIQGVGGLAIEGGTQTISGTSNNYSGPTTINSGTLLAGGTNTLSSNSVVTINDSGKLVNSGTNTIAGLSSSSSSATVDLGANPNVLTIGGTGTFTYKGEIIGTTGGLTIAGVTQILSGTNNTYSSPTLISSGTLQANDSNAFSANSVVTINAGASLVNKGANTIAGLSSISPTAQVDPGASPSILTISGSGTFSYQGNIIGNTGGITIDGVTQILNGANNANYYGPTLIKSGTLQAGDTETLSPNSIVTINSGASLVNIGFNAIAGLNSTATDAQVDPGASGSLLGVSGAGSSSYAGEIISNAGGIAVDQGQILALTGSNNTYSGPTLVYNGSTLEAGANQALSLRSAITLYSNSTLKIDDTFSNTVPSLASASSATMASIGSGSLLTIGTGSAGSSTFAGAFIGSGNLTIAASYKLSLAGAASSLSTLTGTTEIDGELDASSTTPNTLPYASPIVLGTNGVLDLKGQNNTIASLTSSFNSSKVNLSGGTLTLKGATTTSFPGIIGPSGDSGGIYLDSSYQLTLTNDNLYQGSTTVNNGTLTLSSVTGNTIAKSSGVSLGSSGILTQTTSNTINSLASTYTSSNVNIPTGTLLTIGSGTADTSSFAGVFFGAGDLTIATNFTLSLAGAASNANTITGTTTIDGELDASPTKTNTLPVASPIVLGPNGVLNLEGQNNAIVSLASALTSTSSAVNLGGATLTIKAIPPATSSFSGVIGPSGDTGNIYLDGGNQLTLTNNNLYKGTTTVNNGTLILASATGNTIAQSTGVIVKATGILELTTSNTINNPTGAVGSQFQLGSNTLTVNETNTTGTIAGVISGSGGQLVMTGPKTLNLLGANTYSGGTNITGGTLQGNTTSLQGAINVNNSNLIFDQSSNGTFIGTLSSGFGATLTKNGTGVLTLNTSQAGYTGQTNVSAGTLNLNTILGGNMTVLSGGTLTGNGTVGGNLTINGGGTISPGNSIGIITVNGDYVQLPNSTYVWELLSTGQPDLVLVHGTASLAGLLAISAPTNLPLNQDYLVLHADNGVSGTFSDSSTPVSPFFAYKLIYEKNDVFFSYHTVLTNIAETFNQQQVATQIDNIANPTPDQSAFLNSFISLSTDQAREALDEMSGDQYTYLLPLARYANESFRNGIYNAMRNTLDPCWCPDPCERFETWFRAEVGRFNESGDNNCAGIHGTNWDMTVGAHGRLMNGLQIGVAGNYQRNYVTYKQGGRTVRQTGQIAGYVVSRSEYGYFLGEGIYGNSSGSYRRPIKFGTTDRIAKSNPMTSQGLLYGEAGASFEWNCWERVSFLFQPFLGAEFGMYSQSKIKEHGADSLDLRIRRHHQTTLDSLLGLHLTSGVGCVDLSADVVWQHRFDPTKIVLQEKFVNFGDSFEIKGCKFNRNGVRGNLRAAYRASRWIDVYADVSADSWGKWTSYAVDAGINAWW